MITANHKAIQLHTQRSELPISYLPKTRLKNNLLTKTNLLNFSSSSSERDSDSESSHRSTDRDFEIVNTEDVDTS